MFSKLGRKELVIREEKAGVSPASRDNAEQGVGASRHWKFKAASWAHDVPEAVFGVARSTVLLDTRPLCSKVYDIIRTLL